MRSEEDFCEGFCKRGERDGLHPCDEGAEGVTLYWHLHEFTQALLKRFARVAG